MQSNVLHYSLCFTSEANNKRQIYQFKSHDLRYNASYSVECICRMAQNFEATPLPQTAIIFNPDSKPWLQGLVIAITPYHHSNITDTFAIQMVSPLWQMQQIKRFRCFSKITLSRVIQQLLSRYSIKIRSNIPEIRITLTIQNHCSDFDFFNQLATEYGLVYRWVVFELHIDSTNTVVNKAHQLTYKSLSQKIRGEPSVYHMQARTIDLADQVEVITDDYSSSTLKRSASNTGSNSRITQYYRANSGTESFSPPTSLLLAQLNSQRQRFLISTDCPDLHPGDRLMITDNPIAHWPSQFIIISVEHSLKHNHYSSHCLLLPNQQPFCSVEDWIKLPIELHDPVWDFDLMYQSEITPFQSGKIQATNSEDSAVNSQGEYSVIYDSDENHTKLSSVPLLQPYGGNSSNTYGSHWPLAAGTSVIISYINCQLTCPIVYASLNSPKLPSPVNQFNPTQQIIQSHSGLRLLVDDAKPNTRLQLNTADDNQLVCLQASPTNAMLMQSKTADVKLTSTRDQLIQVKNLVVDADKIIYSADAAIRVFCNDQLQYRSGGSIQLSAERKIQLNSSKKTSFITQQSLLLNSETISTRLGSGQLEINCQQGKLQLQGQTINIKTLHQSTGLLTRSSSLTLQKNKLAVMADSIEIQADTIVIQQQAFINSGSGSYSTQTWISNLETLINHPLQLFRKLSERNSEQVLSKAETNTVAADVYPFIACNLRDDIHDDYFKPYKTSNDPFRRDQLSAKEIAYFKSQGNNALLFIPGFSLSYGQFNQTINNPVLRDSGHDDILNGSDSHNWWLHMEDNFNRATSLFQAPNYQNYIRMLHIAWQGDPVKPWDYMAAVATANSTANKLVKLIQQLFSAGIQINIIAHSLGCQVVTQALQRLAEDTKSFRAKPVSQVFLWQAAIPDDCLSNYANAHTIKAGYSCPQIWSATDKVSILLSKNDNVLGPYVPEHHWWQGLKDMLEKPEQDHDLGWMLVLLTLAIRGLDLDHFPQQMNSVYYIGNCLVKPLTWFMQSTQHRHDFYFTWIQQHQDIFTHGADSPIPFHSNLALQTAWLRDKFGVRFEAIVAIFYVIHTGWHNHIFKIIDIEFSDLVAKQLIFKGEPIQDITAIECATVLITLFLSNGVMPKLALGYHGPDYQACPDLKHYLQQGRIQHIDQSHILYTHSGMKIPDSDVFQQIYCQKIWQQNPNFKFGKYIHKDIYAN